jgi:hypothetical protein
MKRALSFALVMMVTLGCLALPLAPTIPPSPISLSANNISTDVLYRSELITSLYFLYGSTFDDFAITTISNGNSQPARIKVETEIIGYTAPAVDTITVEAGAMVEVRQNPLLLPDAIDTLMNEKPATFQVRVTYFEEGQEIEILNETDSILVYARRDFPWEISGFSEQEVYQFLAAWVTPNDPSVEELIRLAANYHPDGMMTSGYNGTPNDDDWDVWYRLAAIWDAVSSEYQVTYVSTMVSFAPGSVQRIRLPSEVLGQRSGNCIELALLFASAAEAIRLHPLIVLLPTHAFLAVRVDAESTTDYFIETTMVGQYSFEDAIQRGGEEYDENETLIDSGAEEYGLVDIPAARDKGVLPIPWH